MANGAPPCSVTPHESKLECCMIKPLRGHDLLSFPKLLLTVLEACPPSGLAPLSPGFCLQVPRGHITNTGSNNEMRMLMQNIALQVHTISFEFGVVMKEILHIVRYVKH